MLQRSSRNLLGPWPSLLDFSSGMIACPNPSRCLLQLLSVPSSSQWPPPRHLQMPPLWKELLRFSLLLVDYSQGSPLWFRRTLQRLPLRASSSLLTCGCICVGSKGFNGDLCSSNIKCFVEVFQKGGSSSPRQLVGSACSGYLISSNFYPSSVGSFNSRLSPQQAYPVHRQWSRQVSLQKPDSKHALSTFARICVEMDFSKGFPREIILQGKDYLRNQKPNYENLSFRCRNYFETWQLPQNCEKIPRKNRTSRSQRPTWWKGTSKELHPKRKTTLTKEEVEAESDVKDPTKGKAPTKADLPKSPAPTQPEISSWADLANEEDPLRQPENQSKEEWKTMSKKKNNVQPQKDAQTRVALGR